MCVCVCLLHVCTNANEPISSPANSLCWGWNRVPVVHQKNWQANKAKMCSSDLWGFPGKIVFSLFNQLSKPWQIWIPTFFCLQLQKLGIHWHSLVVQKGRSSGLLQQFGLKTIPEDRADGDFNLCPAKGESHKSVLSRSERLTDHQCPERKVPKLHFISLRFGQDKDPFLWIRKYWKWKLLNHIL